MSKPVTFYRDASGELHVLKEGEENPDDRKEREKTDEDRHYEAYLEGRQAGKVRRIGGYSDGADRAYFDSSDAFASSSSKDGEEKREYKPAAAYNRGAKIKGKGGGKANGDTGDQLADAMRNGAGKLQQALDKARAASDDEDEGEGDDDGADPNAAQLASRAMQAYNTPISNLTQADVYGNDLNLPKRERKLRKFLECFAEDVSVQTVDGKVVLKDFEDLRKRYGTVFRESGAALRGTTRRRFVFGDAFVLDFERHESLVTPRPGLNLDGSMGVMPPRTQDLVVLYRAEGGELAGMWIAPDKADLGGDAKLGRAELEATELFKSFRALVERLADDEVDEPSFQSFLPEGAEGEAAAVGGASRSTATGTPAGGAGKS